MLFSVLRVCGTLPSMVARTVSDYNSKSQVAKCDNSTKKVVLSPYKVSFRRLPPEKDQHLLELTRKSLLFIYFTGFKYQLWRIVESTPFEYFIMTLIVLNTILLMMKVRGQVISILKHSILGQSNLVITKSS